MNNSIFQINMKKLIDTFGQKIYPSVRNELFWNIVKDLDDSAFSRQVDLWITTMKTAPLGTEFQEFVKKQNYHKQIQIKTNLANDNRCKYCADVGLILTTDPNGLSVAFKCSYCSNANQKEKIAYWSDKNSNDHTVHAALMDEFIPPHSDNVIPIR